MRHGKTEHNPSDCPWGFTFLPQLEQILEGGNGGLADKALPKRIDKNERMKEVSLLFHLPVAWSQPRDSKVSSRKKDLAWAEQEAPGSGLGWAGLGGAGRRWLSPFNLDHSRCVEPPEAAQYGGVRPPVDTMGAQATDLRGPSVDLLLHGLG